MRTALDDAPIVHHEDDVGLSHGGEPMRDDQRCPSVKCGGERLLHRRLALGVQVRGGLIEDHDARALEQEPSDRQTLLLTTRKAIPAIAHHGAETRGQAVNEIEDASIPQCAADLVVARIGSCVPEIRTDGVVEEMCVLGHHADDIPQ
jgi:hypothetical protein